MVIAAMGRSYGRGTTADRERAGAMELNPCAASPLSLRERAGVRAPFATKPAVEKAAPFSTLRCWSWRIADPFGNGLRFCEETPEA